MTLHLDLLGFVNIVAMTIWDNLAFALIMLGWIMILLLASKLVENLWVKAIGFRVFRIFVAPGIIVHEYSHAIACLLTRAKIHEISLFSRNGGYVKHEEPKFPPKFNYFSKVFISFAPVIGCILVMWFMIWGYNQITAWDKVDEDAAITASDDEMPDSVFGFGKEILVGSGGIWYQMKNIALPIIRGNWWLGIIFLWLMLSLSVGMAPSSQDVKNSFIGIIFLVVLLLIVSWGATAFSEDNQFLISMLMGVKKVISFTLAIMAFAIGVSLIIAAPIGGLLRSSN